MLHRGLSMVSQGISAPLPSSLILVAVGLFLAPPPPPPFFLPTPLFHPLLLSIFTLSQRFFTEAPPSLLIELALASGSSVAKLDGNICVLLPVIPGLFSQKPPLQCATPHPKLLPDTPRNTVRNFITSTAGSRPLYILSYL